MRILLCVVVFLLSATSSFSSFAPLPLGLLPSVLNKQDGAFNSTKFLEQITALASADLSFVDRRVLHKSRHSSGAPFTPKEIAPLRRSFLRFFSLLLLDDVQSITPSHDVDQYWHEFILFTAAYREFCDEHFGRFIDHWPEDIETEVAPMKMSEEQAAENAERKSTNADGWTVTVRYLKWLYGEDWEVKADATDATATAACASCGACVGGKTNSTSCGSCGSGGCSGKKGGSSKKKAGCGSCGSGGCSGKKAEKKKSGACGSCGSGGCSGKKAKKGASCGSCGAKTTVAPTPSTSTSTTAGCGSGCGSSCGGQKRKAATTSTSTTTGGCGSSCGSCSGKKAATSTTATTTTTTTSSCGSCGAGGCSGKKAAPKEAVKEPKAGCGSCGTTSAKLVKNPGCGSCGGKKEKLATA